MKSRYFIHSDGSLFRFSDPYRYSLDGKTIRENYSKHHSSIESAADFKATLRAGPYAWPGGYPLYFFTSDGGVLSFDSARVNASEIIASLREGSTWDGWHVCGCEVNWEDSELYCDHSGERIESAYAEED